MLRSNTGTSDGRQMHGLGMLSLGMLAHRCGSLSTAVYVVFEREAREFQIITLFHLSMFVTQMTRISSLVSLTHIITRKIQHSNTNSIVTNARTQVLFRKSVSCLAQVYGDEISS